MSAFGRCPRHLAGVRACVRIVNALPEPFPATLPNNLSLTYLRLQRRLLRRKRAFFAHFTSRNIRNYFLSAQPYYKVNSPLTGRAMSSWR